MTRRAISEIERELSVVRRIDDKNRLAVESSDRPLVDSVFAASSQKRRKILERELMDAESAEHPHATEEIEMADTTDHCRPDFLPWEQRATCRKCAAPLADNPLVSEAMRMSNVNAWAKRQLVILSEMAEYRGLAWFAEEARRVAGGLRVLTEHTEVRCVWVRDEDDGEVYDGACGVRWEFQNDGPRENETNFCPRCGGRVEVVG